ncbi:Melibiase-domain-containing protein [Blakeslea trispora]|nr:Melibiase-domain-containing protein [Blakeslea trispora]
MQILKPGICSHPSEPVWFIVTEKTTYVVGVDKESGVVLNSYWGPRLLFFNDVVLPIKLPKEGRSSQDPAITSASEEYPAFGGLRYGPDVLRLEFENGTRELDLIYSSSKINSSNTTLMIELKDRVHQDFRVELNYGIDSQNDLIIRRATIVSQREGESYYDVTKAHTAAWHIPRSISTSRTLVTMAGAWSCETQVQTHSMKPGTSHTFGSTRGIPSAQSYPWFAIQDHEHEHAEVYFGTLGWSGNWQIEVHTDIEGQTRVIGGIHDRDFHHRLTKGEALELPCFVAGYTTEGLSGARRSITSHIRDNKSEKLVPTRNMPAPVLYNGWEAYGFDVNFENQKIIAKKAADLGVELFVLDDGWFYKRHSDKAGLGDWFVDPDKFPEGLKPLSDYVHQLGMKFGLWFEPEMVNPDSLLYRKHPDWIYHYPDRKRHLERNQLVLNISLPEVRHYLVERMVSLVKQVGIDYIKWDMNRPISEAGPTTDRSVWVSHIQSYHEMIETIKLATNKVSIETCCSGGGRSDLSILKKVESCWTSDNTRPDARLKIQYGTSFVVPPNTMSCWVTDSPNDDAYTRYPISYRFHVSFMGALGIGSNLNKLSQEELEEYKQWINLYKELRMVIQRGNLDWIQPPSDAVDTYTAVTQTTNAESTEAVVLAFRQQSPFALSLPPVRLKRLIESCIYDVIIYYRDPCQPIFRNTRSGASLMYRGLSLPYLTYSSNSSVFVHIKQKLCI